MKTSRAGILLLLVLMLSACDWGSNQAADNHTLEAPPGVQNSRFDPALAGLPTSTPRPTLVPYTQPVAAQCVGFEPDELCTVGDVVRVMGQPEKLYQAHSVNYCYGGFPYTRDSGTTYPRRGEPWYSTHLLYPQKGVDFIMGVQRANLSPDTPILRQSCYVPVAVEVRMRQLPQVIISDCVDLSGEFADWVGYNNTSTNR
jgi:hypothetical protein